MNRFFIILLAFMVTSAMNAEQVTKQAALQKAKQFMPGKNFTVAKSRSLARGVDPQTEEADFYILNADNGGYAVINKLFAERLVGAGATLINREEDIGLEGLRKAKLSYYPLTILDKYHATI